MNTQNHREAELFSRRPALRLVLLLCFGIIVARYVSLSVWWTWTGAFVGLISVLALLFVAKRNSVAGLLLGIIVVLAGAGLQLIQQEDFAAKQLMPVSETEEVVFRGRVAEEPNIRPRRVQVTIDVELLSRAGRVQQLERRVIVYGRPNLFGSVEALTPGATVAGRGVLQDYPFQRNPGEFDYGRYLELNGVHGMVALKDSGTLMVDVAEAAPWWALPGRLRSTLLSEIDSLHSEQGAAFLRGILLADRSKIPEDVRQSFMETGTIHVLAVSGLHVGVIALIFYGAFGLFRLPRRLIVVGTIIGLLFYMLLVGAPPSVVRATVMAIVILVGLMLERKVDIYQSLSVAALILLLWDSNNLFNVGFQLSFVAVLSIVYFYPILSRLIRKLPESLLKVRPVEWALQLFAVSLAAQIGTLPFTAYYFDQISIVSLVANVVVVPAVGVNVTLGFTTLVFAPFSQWLAQNYAALNDLLVAWLLGIVSYAAAVPFASMNTAHLLATFPAFYYIGVFGLVNLRNSRLLKFFVIAGLLLLNIVVYSSVMRAESSKLRITFVDVWQGDAMLLEFPSGKTVLLDAGSRTDTFDSGERTIAPLLRYKGIDELDALIMSHPHSDHIGGVPYLLEHLAIKKLIEPTVRGESFTYEEIHRKAAERSIPVMRYEAGTSIDIDNSARLYILHPFFRKDSTESLNNASLVIKLVYGESELLLVGDAEKEVEGKLLRRYGSFLRGSALKVGHHGSATSSSAEFVSAVQPNTAVISVGKNNKFGHPSREVLNTLRQHGAEVHRTDKQGAVILESDGAFWSVVDWREE